MDEKIIKYAYRLKKVLDEHEEVIKLNEIEVLLNENAEVKALQSAVLDALEKLSEANEYSYLVAEQKAARKVLHLAKLKRDENPLIQKYLKQYQKVKKLYDQINQEIFDPFCESDGVTCRVK
ncbi:MAG TPA: YlbF family regulator [Bacilli bacterium]|nr:YlbF family regulator [Bacilli bacterium]